MLPNQKPADPLDKAAPKPPKYYVRTLESDTAALKQGAKPGFAEIGSVPEPAPEKEESVKPREFLPPEPLPLLLPLEPKTPPPPPPPLPEITVKKEPPESARARIVEGSLLPNLSLSKAPDVQFTPPPLPIPAPPEQAPLHTYTSDFAKHLKETMASTATVLAAEGDAGTSATRKSSSSTFNIPLIVGGLLYIVLGASGVYATYWYLSSSSSPIQIAPVIAAPIFVNEREEVSGVGSTLVAALNASIQKKLDLGSIRLLYYDKNMGTTTGNNVFHALQLPAPNILLRNINPTGSMAGIVNTDGAATLFFILEVSSYGDTFAGMLAWEPNTSKDMVEIFPFSSTTTSAFRDELISNHDIRVLRDASGQSILLYGYWSPTTLVIARNESAYSEIIDRLSTSHTTH